ncbi:MAG: hypothetical protein AVDCRST_MAG41-1764, partial [uncultured Corynebacteriales bacterium]
ATRPARGGRCRRSAWLSAGAGAPVRTPPPTGRSRWRPTRPAGWPGRSPGGSPGSSRGPV